MLNFALWNSVSEIHVDMPYITGVHLEVNFKGYKVMKMADSPTPLFLSL